jgi:hypothetical protein
MRLPAGEPWSLPAAADYSATVARLVVVNGSGQIATGAAGSPDVVGVMYNAPNTGEQARVEKGSVDRIEAGTGGLALGNKIKSDANGKGVNAATTGDQYHGICICAAAAGEIALFVWARGAIP